MATILQHDKRSGLTYAYESVSYWDKEKQQSRARRTLLGRVNPESGEIEATDGRGRRRGVQKIKSSQLTPLPSRRFYGATYLFDEIGRNLGIDKDLQRCFPDSYKQIMSIAYYLIMEDASPLFRFEKWHKLHKHPCNQDIPSQRSSELFASINQESRYKFFRLLSKRRAEKEFWVYDTTSISSCSEQLKQVKRGHNKEHDQLAQFNLAMVFGEQSMLPFYYRKMPGNMTDVVTVKQLMAELNALDLVKIKLVMDRGFYSAVNLNGLYREHMKFLIAARISLKFIRANLDGIYDNFRSFEYYHEGHKVYARTIKTTWDYTQERPYKKDMIESQKRLYIHYYYNITQAAEKEQKFDSKLNSLRQELISGNHVEQHQELYAKYFEIKRTPKRGVKMEVKADVVAQEKRYMGFFALLSNDTMSAFDALDVYRNKDLIEKAFGNLKERLNLRRALVSSEESLDGKLFVEFIALIYLSELQKRMRKKNMFEQYTLQGVLDELDLIECYELPNKQLQVAEVLKKQVAIYNDLEIAPPTSL